MKFYFQSWSVPDMSESEEGTASKEQLSLPDVERKRGVRRVKGAIGPPGTGACWQGFSGLAH